MIEEGSLKNQFAVAQFMRKFYSIDLTFGRILRKKRIYAGK